MKIPLLLLFFSCFPFSSNAQDSIKVESVPKTILAVLKPYSSLGKIGVYCNIQTEKINSDYAVVAVSSIENCSKYSEKFKATLIGVMYLGKEFYVEVNSFDTLNTTELDKVSALSFEGQVEYRNNAINFGETVNSIKILALHDKMNSFQSKGICLIDYNNQKQSEYSTASKFYVDLYNPTKKRIKYVWISAVGYNAVDDPIIESGRTKATLTFKCIGPIEIGEFGHYNYDYAWFSSTLDYAVITQIKVQYFDGTFKSIKDSRSVSLPAKDLEFYKSLD